MFFRPPFRPGLDVYSCSWAAAYDVTSNRIADSIEKQAVDGFDFTQTIKRAHADGVRVFIEAGPRASCTRMIDQILKGQPYHLAVAANHGNEDEIASLLRCVAILVAERVPVNLAALTKVVNAPLRIGQLDRRENVSVAVGGHMLCPTLPEAPSTEKPSESASPAPKKLFKARLGCLLFFNPQRKRIAC
jgi:acyl transferase domain-containing protein